MHKDEMLAQIKSIPWGRETNAKVLNCYPGFSQQPSYAMYSASLDRFLVVDSLDIWSLYHAARLLSSKLTLTVCIFSKTPPFTGEDCILWAVDKREGFLPKKQTPNVIYMDKSVNTILAGPPIDFVDDLQGVVTVVEFAQFVVKATRAVRLTELFLNSNPVVFNEDQKFYMRLFSEEDVSSLELLPEQTPWPKGFETEISSLLYRAQSVEEILSTLTRMFREASVVENKKDKYRQAYLKYFFDFLGWEPAC